MAFKMKGSPMKRNFGIGASPAKQGLRDPRKDYSDPEVVKAEVEGNKRMIESRKKHNPDAFKTEPWDKKKMNPKRSEGGLKTLPIEERARLSEERGDKEKKKRVLEAMSKKSPAKQKKDEKTVEYREGDEFKNEKGQSQKDILDKRAKNVKESSDKAKNYKGKVDAYAKDAGGLTQEEADKANKRLKELNENIKRMNEMYTHSADSISNVNRQYDINRKKKSDDSGLFAKSPYKQFEEGDYYDTRSKKRKKN